MKRNRKQKAKYNAYHRKYRQMHKLKVKARHAVFVALRNGTLTTERCHCGIIGEAHHENYEKPLEILWLCKHHHTELHNEKRLNKKHEISM